MEWVKLIARIAALEEQVRDLVQRVSAVQIARVQEHIVKDNLRHVRVAKEQHGGQAISYLVPAGVASAFTDEPLPPIGSLVEVRFVEGNPHYPLLGRTLPGATNPPDETQLDPVLDSSVKIPGDYRSITAGNSLRKTEGEAAIAVTKDLTITSKEGAITIDAQQGGISVSALTGQITITGFNGILLRDARGASIELKGGVITIKDSQGKNWQLGGGQWRFDLGGGSFQVVNATSFSVNGKQVATIDALDDAGDRITTKGWQ